MVPDVLVSVIIPVYNAASFLAEAVESIRRQSYEPLEIILVDDGSTDDSAKVAGRLPVPLRYAFQPNSGPAAARNRGLEMAQGEVIGFLDADDWWTEQALESRLTALRRDPAVEVARGLTQFVRLKDEGALEKIAAPFCFPNLGSALFKRSVFDRVGLFDESLRYSEDLDWFMRARANGVRTATLETVTQLYRVHDASMTRHKHLSDLGIVGVLKKSLDERRRCGGMEEAGSAVPVSLLVR